MQNFLGFFNLYCLRFSTRLYIYLLVSEIFFN